jgi:hypothetical protein
MKRSRIWSSAFLPCSRHRERAKPLKVGIRDDLILAGFNKNGLRHAMRTTSREARARNGGDRQGTRPARAADHSRALKCAEKRDGFRHGHIMQRTCAAKKPVSSA